MDMKLRDVAQQLVELTTMRESQRQLIALVQSLNDTVITSERRIRETITTTTTTVTSTTARQLIQNGHPTTETTAETSTTTAVSTESISKLKLEFSRFQKRAVCQIVSAHVIKGSGIDRRHLPKRF
jgi:hypothetical protein